MNKYYFKIIGDSAFCFFAAFGVAVTALAYYLSSAALLTASGVIAACAATTCFFYSKRKTLNRVNQTIDFEKKAALLDKLCFSSQEEIVEELVKAAVTSGVTVERKNGETFFDGAKIAAVFKYSGTSPEDLVKLGKNGKTTLFCNYLTAEAEKILDKFRDLTVLDIDKTYCFFKKSGYFPETEPRINKQFSFKRTLGKIFKRDKALNLLLGGLTLSFLSFFTPFKTYYVISAAIFTLLAIVARFYGK